MSKPIIFNGLSLTISDKEVIVIGDIVLSFYKADNGSRRVKINAPKERTIVRVPVEKYKEFLDTQGDDDEKYR